MNDKLIKKIRSELKTQVDLDYKKGCENFFIEKIICYGVRTPLVRKIAQKYFKEEVRLLDKKDLFTLCEDLFESDYNEEATIAIQFLSLSFDRFEKKDFKVFTQFLNKYINNWAKDDDFCTHVLGVMLGFYPELILELKKWTKSQNMWVRRASAVSFISSDRMSVGKEVGYVARDNLKDVFEIAKTLMKDKEDLVQKGYGWMLKVAANFHQQQVFEFVMENKKEMTRTALRYAIEKMPKKLKSEAMKID